MSIPASSSGERIQRRHKRYIISGPVTLQGTSGAGLGTLVNLGRGGVLIRSNSLSPRAGDKYAFHFTVPGYDGEIEAGGIVVGGHSDLLALRFLHEPAELETVLNFMEQSNCPWAGAN